MKPQRSSTQAASSGSTRDPGSGFKFQLLALVRLESVATWASSLGYEETHHGISTKTQSSPVVAVPLAAYTFYQHLQEFITERFSSTSLQDEIFFLRCHCAPRCYSGLCFSHCRGSSQWYSSWHRTAGEAACEARSPSYRSSCNTNLQCG